MNPYEFNISFRLSHPSGDLSGIYDKLSRIPNLIPQRIWKAGDDRMTQNAELLDGKYNKSYCYLSLFNDPQQSTNISLTNELDKILVAISALKSDLDKHIESGGETEFFIGLYFDSNSAESFSPDLMRKLADLGIHLTLDFYPPSN